MMFDDKKSVDSGFAELTSVELSEINGGIAPVLVFLGGAAVTALVSVACDFGNEYLKNATGKGIGEHIGSAIGSAMDAVGGGMQKFGRMLQ